MHQDPPVTDTSYRLADSLQCLEPTRANVAFESHKASHPQFAATHWKTSAAANASPPPPDASPSLKPTATLMANHTPRGNTGRQRQPFSSTSLADTMAPAVAALLLQQQQQQQQQQPQQYQQRAPQQDPTAQASFVHDLMRHFPMAGSGPMLQQAQRQQQQQHQGQHPLAVVSATRAGAAALGQGGHPRATGAASEPMTHFHHALQQHLLQQQHRQPQQQQQQQQQQAEAGHPPQTQGQQTGGVAPSLPVSATGFPNMLSAAPFMSGLVPNPTAAAFGFPFGAAGLPNVGMAGMPGMAPFMMAADTAQARAQQQQHQSQQGYHQQQQHPHPQQQQQQMLARLMAQSGVGANMQVPSSGSGSSRRGPAKDITSQNRSAKYRRRRKQLLDQAKQQAVELFDLCHKEKQALSAEDADAISKEFASVLAWQRGEDPYPRKPYSEEQFERDLAAEPAERKQGLRRSRLKRILSCRFYRKECKAAETAWMLHVQSLHQCLGSIRKATGDPTPLPALWIKLSSTAQQHASGSRGGSRSSDSGEDDDDGYADGEGESGDDGAASSSGDNHKARSPTPAPAKEEVDRGQEEEDDDAEAHPAKRAKASASATTAA